MTRFWEKSRKLEPAFALTRRNLGLAYAQHEKNVGKVIVSLERACELNPSPLGALASR